MAGAGAWQVRVRGLVQGVGFRPAVWRLATQAGLRGEVLNDAEGVLIRLACPRAAVTRFVDDLRRRAPPLSRIDAVEIAPLDRVPAGTGFTIAASAAGAVRTGIVPDAATCAACLEDILDPQNRRFGYAFTNCTDCGPRLSITRRIPYDRANTAMSGFTMCPQCQREYDDPADRRFHAQPNACPDCGPRLVLVDGAGRVLEGDPIGTAAALLKAGRIVAVKGLGGFQLACDATDAAAVATLRARKRRPAKPLALMGRDLTQIGAHVRLCAAAKTALAGPQAPIVLVPARPETALAPGIAPGQGRLGFMLPNTPLHHLLLGRLDRPLVMTSGNLSSEPQVTDNDDALSRLRGIADAWLMHDREIVNRLDDSVVQIVDGRPAVLRRARGHAPAPLQLHADFAAAAPVLATGADLKNTFCMLKDGQAIVSQHMGDMENARTHRDFRDNLALFSDIHDFAPSRVAVDLHPGYFSTRLGHETAAAHDIPLVGIQHHHAHIAATLAEHGVAPDAAPVLGIVLDGLGHGGDGTIWGGEFLWADYLGFRRLAHFQPVALPGGDKANRQPWRNALAHLLAVFGPDFAAQARRRYGALPVLKALGDKPAATLAGMVERGLNAPPASSAGRLFDAVAAALGICFDQVAFEGQAAMRLQTLAETRPDETGRYPVEAGEVIRWHGLWHGILGDLRAGRPAAVIAARFHNTLAGVLCDTAAGLVKTHAPAAVVLSGGVFQNRLLLESVQAGLAAKGLDSLVSRQFPANDGAIALGQATIAAARALDRARP